MDTPEVKIASYFARGLGNAQKLLTASVTLVQSTFNHQNWMRKVGVFHEQFTFCSQCRATGER